MAPHRARIMKDIVWGPYHSPSHTLFGDEGLGASLCLICTVTSPGAGAGLPIRSFDGPSGASR